MTVAKVIVVMFIILGAVFVLTHLPSSQVTSTPQTIQTKEISNFTYIIYQFHITSNSTSEIVYPLNLDHPGNVNITISSIKPIYVTLYNNSKSIFNDYGSNLKYSFYAGKNLTFKFVGDIVDVKVIVLLS